MVKMNKKKLVISSKKGNLDEEYVGQKEYAHDSHAAVIPLSQLLLGPSLKIYYSRDPH